MEKTAYVFHELDASIHEGHRLSVQAQAFVDLELPGLLSKIPSNASVADFGCGTGVISSALAIHLPHGSVHGLDQDERALEMAAQHGKGIGNLSFESYGFNQEKMPKSGPFDVAFARLVLLHLPDPAAALASMGRCLKPGGLLYIVDCDDDYNNFEPSQPWQAELTALMKQAQALRGGTRVLGSSLLKILQEGGFWPEGSQVLYYSTEILGLERWKEIFMPEGGGMAGRDLQQLAKSGAIDLSRLASLADAMRQFFKLSGIRAQISTWHAWARKR